MARHNVGAVYTVQLGAVSTSPDEEELKLTGLPPYSRSSRQSSFDSYYSDVPDLVHVSSPALSSCSFPPTPQFHFDESYLDNDVKINTVLKAEELTPLAKRRGFRGAPLDLQKQHSPYGMLRPLSPLLSSSLRTSLLDRVSSFISRSPSTLATPINPSPLLHSSDVELPDPFAMAGETYFADGAQNALTRIFDFAVYTEPMPKPRSPRKATARAPSLRHRTIGLQVYEACIPDVDSPAVTLLRAASTSARSDTARRRRRERRAKMHIMPAILSPPRSERPENQRQHTGYPRALSPRPLPRLRSFILPKRLGISGAPTAPVKQHKETPGEIRTRQIDDLIGLIDDQMELAGPEELVELKSLSSSSAVSMISMGFFAL